MAWISRHKHSVIAPDQDALNVLFLDSIKIIDTKFNYLGYSKDPNNQCDDLNNRITHIIDPKPWRELKGLATERLYWTTYLRSAWGENATMDDLIGILGRVAPLSPYMHRHTKQCYLNIGHRLLWDTIHPVFWKKIWVLLRELYARIWYRKDTSAYHALIR